MPVLISSDDVERSVLELQFDASSCHLLGRDPHTRNDWFVVFSMACQLASYAAHQAGMDTEQTIESASFPLMTWTTEGDDV
jgi:hypothetical protein